MKWVVYTQPNCEWCDRIKYYLRERGIQFEERDAREPENKRYLYDNGFTTVPQVFRDSLLIGGFQETHEFFINGEGEY